MRFFVPLIGKAQRQITGNNTCYKMTIAIIAHDGRKADMVAFVKDHINLFKQKNINLIATGTTGSHLERAGLEVEKMSSGPMGGDAQIASRLVEGKIDMVIFFRDPLGKHPHEVDVNMLMRLCDVYNIPLATNHAAAMRFVKTL
jgi:methylglyoxal synthase